MILQQQGSLGPFVKRSSWTSRGRLILRGVYTWVSSSQVNPLMAIASKNSLTILINFSSQSIVINKFEGEILVRTLPTTLSQIFCEIIFNPRNHFQSQSYWRKYFIPRQQFRENSSALMGQSMCIWSAHSDILGTLVVHQSEPQGVGGTQVQKGAAPSLCISRKKGSFFKTSACPRFCKRRVLFCTQVRSMGVKIPLQSTKYTGLWRRVTPEMTQGLRVCCRHLLPLNKQRIIESPPAYGLRKYLKKNCSSSTCKAATRRLWDYRWAGTRGLSGPAKRTLLPVPQGPHRGPGSGPRLLWYSERAKSRLYNYTIEETNKMIINTKQNMSEDISYKPKKSQSFCKF